MLVLYWLETLKSPLHACRAEAEQRRAGASVPRTRRQSAVATASNARRLTYNSSDDISTGYGGRDFVRSGINQFFESGGA